MTDRRFKQAKNPFPWYGFNVQKGHIFGTIDDVKYVSAAEPGRDGTIRVYTSPFYAGLTSNWRKWDAHYVQISSPAGQRIMTVKSHNPETCVEIKDVQIDSAFLRGDRQRAKHHVWKKH